MYPHRNVCPLLLCIGLDGTAKEAMAGCPGPTPGGSSADDLQAACDVQVHLPLVCPRRQPWQAASICHWSALDGSPGKFLVLWTKACLELVQGEVEPETEQSPSESGRLVIGSVDGIQCNGIASAFEGDSAVDFGAIRLPEGVDVPS